MSKTHKPKQWFGFTEDKVFGMLMENKEFCKYVLQAALPHLKIVDIKRPELQKWLENEDRNAKDVRLDVLVMDGNEERIFNVEMQVVNKHNLDKRMRYYLSKVDAHYTLEPGQTYNNLKETYIIFLCDFDYFQKGWARYVVHEYVDQDKSLMLPTNSTKVIINAKGKLFGENKKLQNVIKLRRGQKVTGDKDCDYAQKRIVEINNNEKLRREIMDYETRMLDREQEGEQKEALRSAQGMAQVIKDMGGTTAKAMQVLKQKYGQYFSEAELKEIIQKA